MAVAVPTKGVDYVALMACELADRVFPEKQLPETQEETKGDPKKDSLQVLAKEVARVEEGFVNKKKATRMYAQKGGLDIRLINSLNRYNMESVADLLKMGRREFLKVHNIGPQTVECVDKALLNLYDIVSW